MISNLVGVSKKGVLALYSGQAIKFLFQVLSIIVLAKLLSPKDYGVSALALSILGIGEVFRDSGLSTAAIQSKEISHQEKSNLFWVSFSIGLFLFVILFVVSPLVAEFYHEHELENVLKVVGVCFIINGIVAQYKVGINRALQFKSLATGEVASYVLSVVSAILMAAYGFQYWSIIFQQVIQSLLLFMIYLYYYRWLPSLPDLSVSIKKFINFGADLVAIQVIGQITRSLDTFVIGSQFGSDALGFYNRAQQIVKMAYLQLVIPSTTLALPVLSKLKDDTNEYYRFVSFGQSALIHVIYIIFSLVCINSEWIIYTLLGAEWGPSAGLLKVLSFCVLFEVLSYSHYWIILSKGLTRQRLKFMSLITPIFILCIYLGSILSIKFIVIGLALAFLCSWSLSLRFLNKNGITISKVLSDLGPIVASYLLALMVTVFFQSVSSFSGLASLFINNVIFFVSLLICAVVSNTFMNTAKSILKIKKM